MGLGIDRTTGTGTRTSDGGRLTGQILAKAIQLSKVNYAVSTNLGWKARSTVA